MTTNVNDVDELDELGTIDLPEEEQRGDGIPRIWWKYGHNEKQPSGFFYTRALDWNCDEVPAPWKPIEIYKGEPGWAAPYLKVLLIAKRSQPYRKVKTPSGDTRKEYVTRWEEGMQVHTEYLCFVEGLPDLAVFSYHGMTGMTMGSTKRKGSIIYTANLALASKATEIFRRKIELNAFWLPLGPCLDRKGKPDFEELAQGSIVNNVDLHLPDKEGRDLLLACYAGKKAIAEVVLTVKEHAEWLKARRTNDDAPEPVAAAPAGRNAPQEFDPDEDIV